MTDWDGAEVDFTRCPACGSEEHPILKVAREGGDVVRCERCVEGTLVYSERVAQVIEKISKEASEERGDYACGMRQAANILRDEFSNKQEEDNDTRIS